MNNNKTYNPSHYKDELLKLENEGFININREDDNLWVLKYSVNTTLSGNWNIHTLNCRGLIVDKNTFDIVARPYPKFFNHNEPNNKISIDNIDIENTKIYEKYDGSLGIMFYDTYRNEWRVSTPGTLYSDQAIWATNYINDISNLKSYEVITSFNEENTYLFEIIYPDNKVVVDYNKEERMVLTGIINTINAIEYDIDAHPYHDKARTYTYDEMRTIHNENQTKNLEGFVMSISRNNAIYDRTKIKLETYLELHRLKFHYTIKKLFNIYSTNSDEYKLIIAGLSDDNIELGGVLKKWTRYFDSEIRVKTAELEHIVSIVSQKIIYFKNENNYNDIKHISSPFKISKDDSIGKWITFILSILNIDTKYSQYIYHRLADRNLKDDYIYSLIDLGSIGELRVI